MRSEDGSADRREEFDPHRVAEIIVSYAGERERRGSGYRISNTRILTAAHVIADAAAVKVRCDADQPGEWSAGGLVLWCDPDADLAVLEVEPAGAAPDVQPTLFGRLRDDRAILAVFCAGYPRWKLREGAEGTDVFRDLHDAVGTVSVSSNRRGGTLEITLTGPVVDPDPEASPWAAMSGAAVWAGDRVIGVVAEHHRREGLGRLTGVRLDRWFDRRNATGRTLAEALGIADIASIPDVVPPPGGWTRVGRLERIREVAPTEGLLDREAELDELAAFCAGPDLYMWWQAGPWAGKTALLSAFVLNPPAGVEVVSFFITTTIAAQSNSDAFTDALIEQLSEIVREDPPTHGNRDDQRRQLLQRAVARTVQAGRRLVLVVDALDEDSGAQPASGRRSIGSVLPRLPHAGMRVVVSSRPDPPVALDVPADHPLRRCSVRRLDPSPHATELKRLAERELSELLAGDPANPEVRRRWDLVGLVTASGGRLTLDDVEEVTGLPPFRLDDFLRGMFGRTIATRADGGGPDAQRTLRFTHETLHAEAVTRFGAALEGYRERLHTWAGTYRNQGWPAETPAYLLESYPAMLADSADTGRLLALVTDRARQLRLRDRTGGDDTSLAQIRLAQTHVLSQPEPDLRHLALLAVHREHLLTQNAHLPTRLPAVWASIGQFAHAEAAAYSITDTEERAWALCTVVIALAAVDRRRARQLLSNVENLHVSHSVGVAIQQVIAYARLGDIDRAETLIYSTGKVNWIAEVAPELAAAMVVAGQRDRAHRYITRLVKAGLAETSTLIASDLLAFAAKAWLSIGCVDHALEVIRMIEDLAAAERSVENEAECLARCVGLLLWAGQPEHAHEVYERAESLLPAAHGRQRTVKVLIELSDAAMALRDAPRAYKLLDSAYDKATAMRVWQEQRHAADRILRVAVAYGDIDGAERMARSLTLTEEQARYLVVVAEALASRDLTSPRIAELLRAAEKIARGVVVPAERVEELAALSVALVRAGRISEARRLYVLARSVAVATRPIWQPEVLAALATVAYAVGDVAEAKALAYNITKCEWIHVRDPLGAATDVVTRIGGSYQRMIIRILKRRLHSDSVSFLVAFVSALKAQDRIGPAERLARRLRDPAVFADLARAAFRAGDTRRARRLTELAKKRGAHADELRVLDGPEEQTDDEPDQALQSGDRSTTRRLVAEALTENHWQESVAILGQLAPDVLITMATELLAIGLPEGG